MLIFGAKAYRRQRQSIFIAKAEADLVVREFIYYKRQKRHW
jgi:hypothetical protein